MNTFIVGISVLLLSMFGARLISEKANKHLDKDLKAGLVDLFSRQRIYSFVVLLALLGLYFFMTTTESIDLDIGFMAFAVFVIIYFVAIVISSNRILRKNNYPAPYIKSYLLSTAIRFLGLLVFFILMLSETLISRP